MTKSRTSLSHDDAGEVVWTVDGFLARAWHSLEMALQPIALMKSGTVYGYEALMRGYQAMGLSSIAEVLDMAHELGEADTLHLLLLEKSLKKLTSIEGSNEVKLFFNLDGRALEGQKHLARQTGQLLEKYGFPPSALCLEFSETYDYAKAKMVEQMVTDHRSQGIRFAIDDFGRGCSELKVLYEYHPEFIKIDRFFVTGMVADSRKRLFISTLINFAHVLGSRIVVEGVETQEEYRQCWRLGADLVQGYFVCPPRLDFEDGALQLPHLRLSLQSENTRHSSTSTIVHDRLETLNTVSEMASMSEVFEAFRFSREQAIFPVLDAAGEPKGLVRESDLKEFTYSPYGRDLLVNSSCRRRLSDFIRDCPIAEIHTSADAILDIFAYCDGADGIIMTDNAKYAGFLSARSLLEIINDKRLERARDQNPLSNLPGNVTVTEYCERLALKDEKLRHFCYFDFDHFKPFNDNYSFREGDRAITIFADLLKRQFHDSRYMIGHVGGDDFFLGAEDVSPDELLHQLQRLRERFATSAASLYRPDDRERGHILGMDRYGHSREFPLLQCSIAMLTLTGGVKVENIDPIMFEITRLKREAKRSPSGIAQNACRLAIEESGSTVCCPVSLRTLRSGENSQDVPAVLSDQEGPDHPKAHHDHHQVLC
ncbi:GGDEF domain-containing protein [Notoacmeibacter ruber]|uniref:GGDEF domain-containing protein n=1 Tax=Notoacmeibacter ruber TaxID=2670375 RepID=A0A3L7J7Z9_9HYPH|nr:GGDEF domain-containing protein [Notoacmeibacter ruber]RLQ86868.1 GGDEF domain-containing protein [Notoacmeibacter ruber]